VNLYKNLWCPVFDKYRYTEKEDYRALRWVMKIGLDLGDFALEVKGESRSGPVLVMVMNSDKVKDTMDVIMFCATGAS